jgi:hypothetical protein
MKFSQRVGVTATAKEIQKESMDNDLRNRLWNLFHELVLQQISEDYKHAYNKQPFVFFRMMLYHDFFKQPLDSVSQSKDDIVRSIRRYFFSSYWFEVYDLIEFTLKEVEKPFYEIDVKGYGPAFNRILEQEYSAYRLVDNHFIPVTNTTELEEISTASEATASFTALKGCNIHLNTALTLLSDRKSPDYRNSIKESISAIESVVKVVSGNHKDSLGSAIDKIKAKIRIHSSLERAFKQLYGYTSDSDGIRCSS